MSSEQRIGELRDELTAVQRQTVSAAAIQRAVALFDPVWDMLLVPERFRILHLLLESVVYDGITGGLELEFNPLGITSLTAEAAMVEGRDPHSGLGSREPGDRPQARRAPTLPC